MPLVPLLPLFHSFNRKYFEGTLVAGSRPLVSVRWSDGRLRKTAGLYRRGPNVATKSGSEIVLSRPLLEHLPQNAIESTLCHEMIHAWIDLVLMVEEGHGPNFYKRMNLINSVQNEFQISVRHKFPVPKSAPRWLAVCPHCGSSFPYRRLVRGAACKACCDTYHGGHWNVNCLLHYVPAKKEA